MPVARHDEWQGPRCRRAWIFPPMDRCPARFDGDVGEPAAEACARQPDPPNPFLGFFDAALAQVCRARAEALESLGWATEAERVALRAGTALLLDAVARRLGENVQPPEAPVAAACFRLKDLLHEADHEPFVAAYERGREQADGTVPFAAGGPKQP